MYKQASAVLRRFAPLAFALVLFVPTASAAASSCVPTSAKTLEASGAARIYSLGATLYGCLGTRHTRLGALAGTPSSPATRVSRYALAEPYAAVDTVQMGVDNFASRVSVIDLRSGASLASEPAAKPPPRAESFITVTAIALNANGVAAWVARIGAIGQSQPSYELHLLEHRSDQTVSSGTIPIVALALTRTRLSWSEDHAGPRDSLPL
jgi:hypothetical protein